MKKPQDLIDLIKELEEEPKCGQICVTTKDSCVIIRTEDEDDEESIRLNGKECELLFCSTGRVDQLYDALGCPADASVELHAVELEADVLTLLEKLFVAVDEM